MRLYLDFKFTKRSLLLLMIRYAVLLFLTVIYNSCSSKNPIEKIIRSERIKIARVYKNINKHNLQIRYTHIERDKQNDPIFISYNFGVDESRYFYPASTAKLPIVILTLQKLRELQRKGVPIDMHTPFKIKDARTGMIIAEEDITHPHKHITFAHLIKKIFLISDDDAYNYLFDFLGKDYINEKLALVGLKDIQIHHKFLVDADNINTWEFEFFEEGELIYRQDSQFSTFNKTNEDLKEVITGLGYISNNKVILDPMDFRKKNRISILSLEGLLKRILFPKTFSEDQQFKILTEDYMFLRFWMSRNTLESKSPQYLSETGFYDSYVKFLIYGDRKGEMSSNIRIFNKIGEAYGTLTDTAYIIDYENQVEFLLTATIMVNENQIFNDDIYEYDSIGIPFLAELGRQFLKLEQKKSRPIGLLCK